MAINNIKTKKKGRSINHFAYLSPSSLKKSPPPSIRSRKRKRGGNAGKSAPISKEAIVLSDDIIL